MDGELWDGGRVPTGSPSPVPRALAVGFLLLDVLMISCWCSCSRAAALDPVDPCLIAVVVVTVGILAPSHHYLVRFTVIGRLLKGDGPGTVMPARAQLEILDVLTDPVRRRLSRLRSRLVTSPGSPQRRLGVADAVVIGAGSMIGAGVTWRGRRGFQPQASGCWSHCHRRLHRLLQRDILGAVGGDLPGVRRHGVYGRRQLPFWGHVAGWGFVVGKTRPCSATAPRSARICGRNSSSSPPWR